MNGGVLKLKNRISKFLVGKECVLPKVFPNNSLNANIGNSPYSGLLKNEDYSHFSGIVQKTEATHPYSMLLRDYDNSDTSCRIQKRHDSSTNIQGKTLVKRNKNR